MDRKRFLGRSLASAALAHKLVLVAVLCLFAAVACFGEPNGGSNVALAAEAGKKPNILFILTDDADSSLLPKMPEIEKRMVLKGTTFPNAFTPFATCCPSRAAILRGQYPHNTGVISNYGSHGGVGAFEAARNDEDTLATRLDAAGYRTGLFGKYMNEYTGGYVPPGWDEWHGWAGSYASGKIYETGNLNAYDLSSRHEADILGSKAESFVRGAKGYPWFAYVAFKSPHNPTYTESEYADNYRDQRYPRSPAFDEADVSDKPKWVRQLPRLTDEDRAKYNRKYRDRLRAMRSVDDAIAGLLRSLRETGQLDNTYVVLWNDNGYHMGQHRIPEGKRTVYEEDVRYPMVVRGPGVGHDAKDERLVSGIDLMPTFLELAGAPTPEYVDGRSLAPVLSGWDPSWRDSLLLEGYNDGFGKKAYVPPDFKAIRTSDGRTYVEYETGERELYDLRTDPHQLRSLHDEPERAVEESALSARLQALKYCSGKGCRDAERPNPQLHCSPHPPWRGLSHAVPRSFIQLGVGGVWDRGFRQNYPGSCIGTSKSSYKMTFREFDYFGSTSAGR
ncbi:MAG TPA: sulfatase [Rubrobacter sp.]|nr:sulfatase [Rubrobacter sp.]